MFTISAGLAYLVAAFRPEAREAPSAAAPEPYTLPHLIAWLEKRDPVWPYDYSCGSTCLIAQYANALNPEHHWRAGRELFCEKSGWPAWEGGLKAIAYERPWTFGAALRRARELEASW